MLAQLAQLYLCRVCRVSKSLVHQKRRSLSTCSDWHQKLTHSTHTWLSRTRQWGAEQSYHKHIWELLPQTNIIYYLPQYQRLLPTREAANEGQDSPLTWQEEVIKAEGKLIPFPPMTPQVGKINKHSFGQTKACETQQCWHWGFSYIPWHEAKVRLWPHQLLDALWENTGTATALPNKAL